jgi:hypothetical protein
VIDLGNLSVSLDPPIPGISASISTAADRSRALSEWWRSDGEGWFIDADKKFIRQFDVDAEGCGSTMAAIWYAGDAEIIRVVSDH